ncbi:MAG: hypothetical protein AABY22_04960 [Nanoarchaeota archaeon]
MTKHKFRVCYEYMPSGTRFHETVCKKFKRITQAKKYMYGLTFIPKEGSNEKVFERSARLEKLDVVDIKFHTNKKTKGWRKMYDISNLEIGEVEKHSALINVI